MKLSIGLTKEQREGVIGLLKSTLADQYVLYTKTRNFHWNVTGPQFHDLHKLYESQYEAIDDAIDETAERIRSLGGVSPGSLKEMLALARLKEAPGKALPGKDTTALLLADHEAVIQQLRKDIVTAQEKFGDAGTSDYFTGLIQDHEKMAWMLRATLE
jgi:starvation-inducible DNA-binding protein